MAGKHNSFFGEPFDFNGDGKTDWTEYYLANKIFEECFKEENSDDEQWRENFDDGLLLDISPEDYETQEEYEEALDMAYDALDADYDLPDNYSDDSSDSNLNSADSENNIYYSQPLKLTRNGGGKINLTFSLCPPANNNNNSKHINESDYPNKRRYNAACALAGEGVCYGGDYEQRRLDCCKFILEKSDTVLAANYLSHTSGFLYSQAIKDNFQLTISLPDEDEKREFEFYRIICKIAKRDIPQSFEVWSWALEQFLPYEKYDMLARSDLTCNVIKNLYLFPENYKEELVRYMDKFPRFRQKIADCGCEAVLYGSRLIVTAIKEKLYATAKIIFSTCLDKAGESWKIINNLVDSVILWCKNDEEVESIEFFRDNLFPIVKEIQIGMVRDEIAEWEKNIADYIDATERRSKKYEYSRRYAWRKNAVEGEEYGVNPLYYETEEEYLNAVQERKYGWRKWYKDKDSLGLNVCDYETQPEFLNALIARKKEKWLEERAGRRNDKLIPEEYNGDKTVYTVCGVEFSPSSRVYNYKTDDKTIKIGDEVFVSVGNSEVTGTVVSVGQFLRRAAPFPIDKMKTIIRKVNGDSQKGDKLC